MAEYLSKLSVYIVVLMVLAFLFCLTALPIKLFTVNFRDLDDADKLETGVFTLAAVMCGFGNFCILGNIVFEGVSLQITGLLIAGIIAEIIAIRVQKCMIERINSEKKIGRCDFCNDLRNIEPASYLGGGDEEFQTWIKEMRKKKAFIWHRNIDDGVELIAVEKCPVCGHIFTAEEYDDLTFWED